MEALAKETQGIILEVFIALRHRRTQFCKVCKVGPLQQMPVAPQTQMGLNWVCRRENCQYICASLFWNVKHVPVVLDVLRCHLRSNFGTGPSSSFCCCLCFDQPPGAGGPIQMPDPQPSTPSDQKTLEGTRLSAPPPSKETVCQGRDLRKLCPRTQRAASALATGGC